MSTLEGFLQLRDEFGSCVDLIHNCRTMSFLNNTPFNGGFRQAVDCDDCCCEDFDDCEYTTPDGLEPAPWYDPNNPASAEFLGLWGSLNISQPEGDGSITPPKMLTFTGSLISTTKRGKAFGMAWVDGVLSPFCVSCSGREATVFTHCPSLCGEPVFVPPPPEPVDGEGPPNMLDLSGLFDADGCELDGADIPLTTGPPLPALVDDGQRDILRVEYINGSLQQLEADYPECYGCRVTFSFNLLDAETFLIGEPICEISPIDEPEIDVPCRRICIGENLEGPDICGACGIPCECRGEIVDDLTDSPTSNTLADGAAECRYSAPLLCRRYACLIDAFSYEQAAPVVSINAGSQDMTNVSVSIFQATTGLPNPMTALGNDIYGTRQPESQALISRIPAGATLTLDARDNGAHLDCPGFARQSGAPLVSGCDNRKYRHPRLCCGLRYWLIVEVDCFTTTHDDWRITGSIHGTERV